MNIRPCAADRARTIARIRRRQARVVRTAPNLLEVKLGCGCVCEIDFNDTVLAAALEKSLQRKAS